MLAVRHNHGDIYGQLVEDERVFVSTLFAKVLRTDDTDYIPSLYLYPPFSFSHLLTLLYFLHPLAAYLHHIHQQGERGSIAQGKTRWTDRRSPSPRQVWTFFEVHINEVFIKVLRGTYTW